MMCKCRLLRGGPIHNMLFLEWSGLEVKESKCTVLYERRSGGNRWQEIITEYTTRLQKIDASPLPPLMKIDAIRQIALSRVQHFFANVHISRKILQDLNNKTVKTVRRWLGLNSHTTCDVIHHSRRERGLGVPDFEWTYITTQLSHLLSMLNNDDSIVREMAHASLFLDLGKRKVPLALVS